MLTKDIITAGNTEFAVLHPSWARSFNNKNRSNLNLIRRDHAPKVRLVNETRYAYSQRVEASATSPWFREAPKGDKQYAFLVTNGTEYWTAKPADFICLYSVADAHWTGQEEAHAKMQAIYDRREVTENKVVPAKQVALELAIETTKGALKRLGAKDADQIYFGGVRLNKQWVTDETAPDGDRFNVTVEGDVRIGWNTLQRLLQTIAELEEELG